MPTSFRPRGLEIHLTVPDQRGAAEWYGKNLGFSVVAGNEKWASSPRGPLHISADGGKSGLALFQKGGSHPGTHNSIIAFRVGARSFLDFAD